MQNRMWPIPGGGLGLLLIGFLLGSLVWPNLPDGRYKYYTVQGVPVREDRKTGCTWVLLGSWELHKNNPLHCFGLEEVFVASLFDLSRPPGVSESDLDLPVVADYKLRESVNGKGWLQKESTGGGRLLGIQTESKTTVKAMFEVFNPFESCIIKGIAIRIRIPEVYDEYIYFDGEVHGEHLPRQSKTYSTYLREVSPDWQATDWTWTITHLKIRRKIGDSCL